MRFFFNLSCLFFAVIFYSSCSSVKMVDQGRLNHPGMDFEGAIIKSNSAPTALTNLNSFDAISGGGSCSTCAH